MPRAVAAAVLVLVMAAGARAGELGTNLDAVVDYSPQYVFVDAFKQSRDWITQTESTFDTGNAASLDLDADGWVRSIPSGGPYDRVATLLFFAGEQARYPAGTYVVTYDGSGVLEYRFDAVKDPARSTAGRDVLTVTPNVGFAIVIRSTTPGNYLRNIRVWMPGFDETSGPGQPFHPDFLRLLQPYSVLRFMDWMTTNSSTQQEFADRPRPGQARYTLDGKGVPLEVMVDLANRTGKDPWFNMPHRASDDYVSKFAALVRTSLSAGRRVYVEYSNEVWNGQFPQGDYVEAQGQAAFPGGASGFTKRMNFHGHRTAQICDLWQAAFGTEAGRVVCVVGAQAANTFTATEALDCPLSPITPCHAHNVDAVAIAPYFGGYMGDPSVAGTVAGLDLTGLFQEINSGGAVPGGPPGGSIAETAPWISEQRAESQARGKVLVAYEGGQHLVGYAGVENNDAITALFTTANRDARMGAAYTAYLAQWQASGGGLFVHFNSCSTYSKFGSWGAVERLDETATPKQSALSAYASTAPTVMLSIDDRQVAEGAASNAAFRVVLSAPSAQAVTVAYATADQTAVAPGDYAATSGVLTFTPGRTVHSVLVPVVTDIVPEGDETFLVNLSTPTNAGIADGQAAGTIANPPAAMHVALYRAYSRQTDYHFFTTDLASKTFAVDVLGFQDESNPIPFYVWNARQQDTLPLFRMYNPNLGRHYYTADVASRDFLMGVGMVYEKDEGFVYPLGAPPAGTTELFRLYNNNSGTHLFTADQGQKDGILALFPGTWVEHTSVGFVFTSP